MNPLIQFWYWLRRANARRVFYYSLICLLGVAGWWLWREFAPAAFDTDIQYGPPRRRTQANINTIELMDRQLAVSAAISGDPFVLRSYRRSHWTWKPTRPQYAKTNTTTTATHATTHTTTHTTTTTTHHTATTAGQPSVALVYHGMWILTDGLVGARIENRTKKSTGFLAPGHSIEWLKVVKVEREYVEIESESGEIIQLHRGQPLIFRKMTDGE